MRAPLRWALRLLVFAALAYAVLFVYVLVLAERDQRPPADAIVVLGAAQYNGRPSGVLRARLDHAADLYHEGVARVIVVTGGMAEGDRVSEATVSQRYLVGRRVAPAAIVVRPVGRNSHQSVAAAAEWLGDRGLRRVVLVSDPFHMARLRAEARATGLAPSTSPTRTSPISQQASRELAYLAAEAAKLPVVWGRSLLR